MFLAAQTGDRVCLGTPPLAGPSGAESFPDQPGREGDWPDSNFWHIGADGDLGGGDPPFSKKKTHKNVHEPPLKDL